MTEDTDAPASDISDDRPEANAHADAPDALTGTPAASADAPRARRSLVVARAGGRRLAVFAEEAEGASKFTTPAPLPFAPPAVLGVVAVRGRMRTLIDPLALLRPASAASSPPEPADEAAPPPPTLALLLRGDEQLALAVAAVERPVEIQADSILPEPAHDFARGAVTLDGAPVLVLDPAHLFEAAMRGHERRRGR